MTLQQAASQGIRRVRKAIWASPTAYLRINIIPFHGHYNPWGQLYDRPTQEATGEPTPQSFLLASERNNEYVPYDGPLDDCDYLPV